MWHHILSRVAPWIMKTDTNICLALEVGLKLAVIIQYLASEETFRSLAFRFQLSHSSIVKFIPEVSEAIITEFLDEIMPMPNDGHQHMFGP